MYYEPSKRTYYRFPSTKSVAKMDKQMYFQEKPAHATDDLHYYNTSNSFIPEKEHRYDFR